MYGKFDAANDSITFTSSQMIRATFEASEIEYAKTDADARGVKLETVLKELARDKLRELLTIGATNHAGALIVIEAVNADGSHA